MKDDMTDLVERLRDPDADFNAVPLLKEAADEIERLRVALHKSEAGLLLAQFELQALTGREQGLCRTREEADLLHRALLTGREGGKP